MKNNLSYCAEYLIWPLHWHFPSFTMWKNVILLAFPLFNTNKLNYSIEATGKNLKTVLSYFIYLLIIKEAHKPITPDFHLPLVQRELKGYVTLLITKGSFQSSKCVNDLVQVKTRSITLMKSHPWVKYIALGQQQLMLHGSLPSQWTLNLLKPKLCQKAQQSLLCEEDACYSFCLLTF